MKASRESFSTCFDVVAVAASAADDSEIVQIEFVVGEDLVAGRKESYLEQMMMTKTNTEMRIHRQAGYLTVDWSDEVA